MIEVGQHRWQQEHITQQCSDQGDHPEGSENAVVPGVGSQHRAKAGHQDNRRHHHPGTYLLERTLDHLGMGPAMLELFEIPRHKVDRIVDGNPQTDRKAADAHDLQRLLGHDHISRRGQQRQDVRNDRDEP